MESPQISGKVFRFLSAMHPALSKAERKKYAAYDPDQWYDWTPDVSAEFTDLMRRSPRDTSFARGFAYVAQRAVPEGQYIPTSALLGCITSLPAAYRAPQGTGFQADIDRPGHAIVTYRGMPGFANVCIAIQGELMQRLQASGAQSVVVKHAETCRVSGGEECQFDVEWSGEVPPGGAEAADASSLLDEEIVAHLPEVAATTSRPEQTPSAPAQAPPAVHAAEETPRSSVIARLRSDGAAAGHSSTSEAAGGRAGSAAGVAVAAAAAAEPAVAEREPEAAERAELAVAASTAQTTDAAGAHGQLAVEMLTGAGDDAGAANDDLFVQLRKRLADADRQSRMYTEAQSQLEALRVELSRSRAQAEAQIAAAAKERDEAIEALAELKRRIRSAISDD